MFYQRLLASWDKESVAAEIQTTEQKPEYERIIKDPYVLEFLDLPANEHFYESSLEQALINHLQNSSWSWAAGSPLWYGKSILIWMDSIFTLIWCSITIY